MIFLAGRNFKSAFVLIFLFLFIGSGYSQSKNSQQQKGNQAVKQETPRLLTSSDSTQYILGAYLGQYLKANGFTITNANLFIKGMDDVVSGKEMLIPADSVPVRMNEYLGKAAAERSKLLEKQLFEAVKTQPGLGSLPNGVCYLVSREGKGLRPLVSDSVSLNIKGYLPDGTVFEDSFVRKSQLKATPGNLIPGLREILQIMPEGSVWRVYIPAAQAYGEKGIQGIIPPFSALVFDVELVKVKPNK